MTDSTEQTEAHRLITEALGEGARRDYEHRVLDLVFTATAAFAAGEKNAAETVLSEHVGAAEDPDRAAYHVCVATAIATGHLLDGDMIHASPTSENGEVDSLMGLAVQLVNCASAEDETTMTVIMDVIWTVDRHDVHKLARLLISLRAEVIALDERGGGDA